MLASNVVGSLNAPRVTVFCALGVYATAASITDLFLVPGIGFVGFLLRRYQFPLAPVLIGVVLGPLAETSLRYALLASGGDPSVLVGSPTARVMYGLFVLCHLHSVPRRVRDKARLDT